MKGFTFIEIIITIAIILIIIVFSLISLSAFRENQSLRNAVNETISLINQARSQTLSSQDFSQYGIHFESSKAVLFKGATFLDTDASNIVFILPYPIEISNINLNGGGVNLVFQKLTGKTDEYGTVVFRVKNDISKIKTIDIKNTGIINVQ